MQNLVNGDIIFNYNNFERLLSGLAVTAKIAFTSVVLATIFGVLLGVIMTSKNKVVKAITGFYLEVFRIIPILVWLFVVYFGVTATFDIHLEGEFVSILVFSLWGIAEMGDIVRGALTSIPKHQEEAGKVLGLTKVQLYVYILIPQAIRRIIPGAINLSTRMIKTTSLVILIGVVEVVKVGQQIIERAVFKEPTASFWIYGFIFILYFILCYPLSLSAKILERKWRA